MRQGAVAASFLRAGGRDLQDECTAYVRKNGTVPCGEVVVTKPGAIQCSRIIHTVGPVYNGKASEKVTMHSRCIVINLIAISYLFT